MLLFGVSISWVFWEDLRGSQDSLSTTVRNMGLVVGGITAIILAVWRSRVAERQVATAQQNLLNERYQKGAEMLGSEILSVRLGGIYALARLAEEHPEGYHIQIMELLCAFVRHPMGQDNKVNLRMATDTQATEREREFNLFPSLLEDIQAAMTKIGARNERRMRLEHERGYRLNLRGVDLTGGSLPSADLSGADLTRARLSKVDFWNANLSHATLRNADLSWQLNSPEDINSAVMSAALDDQESLGTIMIEVDLTDSDLSGADLSNVVMAYANLTGAQLFSTTLSGSDLSQAIFSENGRHPAEGMTQADLDEACADASGGPRLDGVTDIDTDRPLVWRSKTCPK